MTNLRFRIRCELSDFSLENRKMREQKEQIRDKQCAECSIHFRIRANKEEEKGEKDWATREWRQRGLLNLAEGGKWIEICPEKGKLEGKQKHKQTEEKGDSGRGVRRGENLSIGNERITQSSRSSLWRRTPTWKEAAFSDQWPIECITDIFKQWNERKGAYLQS